MSNSDLTSILSNGNENHVAGLGIATAAIFLAGEMAGSGVLALAYSVVQTGKSFLKLECLILVNVLILYFVISIILSAKLNFRCSRTSTYCDVCYQFILYWIKAWNLLGSVSRKT